MFVREQKQHGPLDVTKLDHLFKKTKLDEKVVHTVLVISGSFNPIHTQHVETLVVAKNWLEKRGETVIAGFLAPSSDDYVYQKLGSDAMFLKHRTALCAIACKEYNWISTCGWGWANGGHTTKQIKTELSEMYPTVKFRALEICGADHAAKTKIWQRKSVVCLGRPGYTQQVKQLYRPTKGLDFYLVEKELKDVSSTKIRDILNSDAKNWSKLVSMRYMDSGSVGYISEFVDKIYMIARKTEAKETKETKEILVPGQAKKPQKVDEIPKEEIKKELSKSQKRRQRKYKKLEFDI